MSESFHLTLCLVVGVLLAFAPRTVRADGNVDPNLMCELGRKTHVAAEFALRSAYNSRGKIVEDRPVETTLLRVGHDIDRFGRLGLWHFHVSSLGPRRQDVHRRAFNEVDLGVFWSYDWEFNDDWKLSSEYIQDWITLHGYTQTYRERKSDATIFESRFEQSLKNPYVTPFYLLRRGYHPSDWFYTQSGLRKSVPLGADFSLSASLYLESGDERHFELRYGSRREGGSYHSGAQALVAIVLLRYRVNDALTLTAGVQQFDIVSENARDSVKANASPCSRRDLTIARLGLEAKF